MRKASARGVLATPKFAPGPNPLELEREIKMIEPTNEDQMRQMGAIITEMQRGAANDRSLLNALALWKVQLEQPAITNQMKFQFLRRFYFWLLGRGTESDVKKTFWGRANAAVYNREVSLYLEAFARKRLEYAMQISLLANRIPEGIVGYLLYFKYIVNGNLKRANDGKSSWWDLSDDDFLNDFELFVQAFDRTPQKSEMAAGLAKKFSGGNPELGPPLKDVQNRNMAVSAVQKLVNPVDPDEPTTNDPAGAPPGPRNPDVPGAYAPPPMLDDPGFAGFLQEQTSIMREMRDIMERGSKPTVVDTSGIASEVSTIGPAIGSEVKTLGEEISRISPQLDEAFGRHLKDLNTTIQTEMAALAPRIAEQTKQTLKAQTAELGKLSAAIDRLEGRNQQGIPAETSALQADLAATKAQFEASNATIADLQMRLAAAEGRLLDEQEAPSQALILAETDAARAALHAEYKGRWDEMMKAWNTFMQNHEGHLDSHLQQQRETFQAAAGVMQDRLALTESALNMSRAQWAELRAAAAQMAGGMQELAREKEEARERAAQLQVQIQRAQIAFNAEREARGRENSELRDLLYRLYEEQQNQQRFLEYKAMDEDEEPVIEEMEEPVDAPLAIEAPPPKEKEEAVAEEEPAPQPMDWSDDMEIASNALREAIRHSNATAVAKASVDFQKVLGGYEWTKPIPRDVKELVKFAGKIKKGLITRKGPKESRDGTSQRRAKAAAGTKEQRKAAQAARRV